MVAILKQNVKLYLPEQYIDRPRITKLFHKITEQNQITYVNAAFDFGKTTAALAFANEIDCVWYSITDKFINEEEVESFASSKPLLLILDNFDCLVKECQKKLISLLIDRKVHCLILSRTYIPTLFQVSPLCHKIGKTELMFTMEEYVEYSGLYFPTATEEQTRYMAELSCGWLPGFKIGMNVLLSGSAQSSDEVLDQSFRQIWRICDEKFWSIMTPIEKDFLLSIGCFKEISVELALLVTGIADCVTVFSDIMAKSSCYVEKRDGIYYLYWLIQNYLIAKRNEILSKEEQNRIWRSAGRYYYLHNELKESLRCYEQANDYDTIAYILEKSIETTFNMNVVWELRYYFKVLPNKITENSPGLCLARTMIDIFAFRLFDAEKWRSKLDILAKTLCDNDLRKKQAESMLLYLSIAFPDQSKKSNTANLMRNAAKAIKEQSLETQRMTLTANRPSVLSGAMDLSCCIKFSESLYKSMSELLNDLYGEESSGVMELGTGEILYYQDKLSEALLKTVGAFASIEQHNSPSLFFAAQFVQLKIMMVSGQMINIDNMLTNIERKIHKLDAEYLMPNFKAVKVWNVLYNNNPCDIEHWFAEEAPNENDNFCTLDRFQYFIKLRIYILKGLYLPFIALADRLRQVCDAFRRKLELIELNTLTAIVCEKMGEREKAMAYLEDALISAEKYDYIRVIGDEGASVYELLRLYAKGKPKVNEEYLTAVTNVAKRMGLRFPNYLKPKLIDIPKLTETETYVLTMMAQSKTNAEISEYLDITINTVKFHSKNIFNKLHVNNRNHAVKNAREQHLID